MMPGPLRQGFVRMRRRLVLEEAVKKAGMFAAKAT
jgi:hypothetical protein